MSQHLLSAAPAFERCRRLAGYAARTVGPHWLRSRQDPAAALDRADYVAGDDYRRIDWNLCARHDELRTIAPPGRDEHSVYLLVDSSASMTGGDGAKFAVARSWARAVGSMALASGARVAVAAIGARVEARLRPLGGCRQAAALERFFDALAAGGAATNLPAAIDDFLRLGQRPGLAIVVSDFLDARGFAPALDALGQARFEPLVAQVVSPEDARPELAGPVELIDAETGVRRRLMVGPAELASYRRHFARFSAALEHYCARHRLGRLQIDTAAGVDAALQQIMRPGMWAGPPRRRV